MFGLDNGCRDAYQAISGSKVWGASCVRSRLLIVFIHFFFVFLFVFGCCTNGMTNSHAIIKNMMGKLNASEDEVPHAKSFFDANQPAMSDGIDFAVGNKRKASECFSDSELEDDVVCLAARGLAGNDFGQYCISLTRIVVDLKQLVSSNCDIPVELLQVVGPNGCETMQDRQPLWFYKLKNGDCITCIQLPKPEGFDWLSNTIKMQESLARLVDFDLEEKAKKEQLGCSSDASEQRDEMVNQTNKLQLSYTRHTRAHLDTMRSNIQAQHAKLEPSVCAPNGVHPSRCFWASEEVVVFTAPHTGEIMNGFHSAIWSSMDPKMLSAWGWCLGTAARR